MGLQLILGRLELPFQSDLGVAAAVAAVGLLGLGVEVEDGDVEGVDGDPECVALFPGAADAVCVGASPEHAVVPEQPPHLVHDRAA